MLLFYNHLLKNNCIPVKLNISVINPILKDDKKSTKDLSNVRPISISNCFAQILEKLILMNVPELSIIHPNQFGFKKKTSCNHAIFTMKETVLHYIENRSACRMVALDAEKAYDKVWRDGLFFKLMSIMSYPLWMLLKRYYDSSRACLLIDNKLTECFPITCGLKQGGIISSFLFNFFINDLLTECLEMNIGAMINGINVCIISYADDLILLSPSDKHLQMLLNKCHEFSILWRITFNSSKSHLLSFGKQMSKNSIFRLGNNELKSVEKLNYLGVDINTNLELDEFTCEKFKKVQRSLFSLSFLGLKPMGVSPDLQAFIYKTYCLSTFTYGLETTTLLKTTRDYLSICQNNLIRQFVGLRRYCRMSNVRKCLKIFDFEQLYIFTKLSFISTLNN